jgi:hypothetical protein
MDEIQTLKGSFERDGVWAEASAWAIVGGLVLEVCLLLWFSKDRSSCETLSLVAANGIIAAGVFGEIHFGRRAARSLKRLQQISDETVASAKRASDEANQKAQEAMLELERLRKRFGPRYIDPEMFSKDIAGQPKLPVQILYLKDDPDSYSLSFQILSLLNRATWDVVVPTPIRPNPQFPSPLLPTAFSVGAKISGVTIVVKVIELLDGPALAELPESGKIASSASVALGRALIRSLGGLGMGTDPTMPEGVLRVVVAPRFLSTTA